ncbi:MAG: type III PLP-dependent enzyme, partial [Alphaproteobacteria bacterium]|nr:type III PLP-dependent enzyme [Alphaproteobacteria bacterium]
MVALTQSRDLVAFKQRRRNNVTDGVLRFGSVEEMVRSLRPSMPVRCFYPAAIDAAAAEFIEGFPGDILYAVKANPNTAVIARLFGAGVTRFDVASLQEIELVHGVSPDAFMAYMHPIKSRESIHAAYHTYGIRTFAIDCFEEMHKILEETQAATDLTLVIRLAMPDDMAHHALSKKFGAQADEAVLLLQDAAKVASKVGLCFHVGHLCTDHVQYRRAIDYAAKIIEQAGVELDVFDVGGGFARTFPGMEASALSDYFTTIKDGLATLHLPQGCKIWCEPGLALAADSESLVVRVELRKGNALYINDGTYGSLFDAAKYTDKKRFPVHLIRVSRKASQIMQPFEFYGPTCDSIDHMPGPFVLPKDARE